MAEEEGETRWIESEDTVIHPPSATAEDDSEDHFDCSLFADPDPLQEFKNDFSLPSVSDYPSCNAEITSAITLARSRVAQLISLPSSLSSSSSSSASSSSPPSPPDVVLPSTFTITLVGHKASLGQTLSSTGLTLWRASPLLCSYLSETLPSHVFNKRVLELGCGLGLASLYCHFSGASSVTATDGDSASLSSLRGNVASNKAGGPGGVACRQLRWGQGMEDFREKTAAGTGTEAGFDTIIAADVIYVSTVIKPLFETVSFLLSSKAESSFVLAYARRNVKIDDVLAEASLQGFDWTSPPGSEGCYVFRRRRRPASVANVAVVGAGGWAQGWHLPDLSRRSDVQVVAIVDPSDVPGVGGCTPDLCLPTLALCEKYGAKRYRTLDELLGDEAVASTLDGVLVAAPHALHADLGCAALKAGKHLLLEKPMSADLPGLLRLCAAAKEARPGTAFLLNHTANWRPGALAAKEAVDAGKIGDVKAASCVFAAPLAWLLEGPEHSSWSEKSTGMEGNGFGWGQLTHTFAWLFMVCQKLVPKTVYASITNSERSGADLVDALIVTCRCGAKISVTGVGTAPDHGFKVVQNWIFGSKGMLSFCPGQAASDAVQRKDGDEDPSSPASVSRLEIWCHDGEHSVGPPAEFEDLAKGGAGPASLDAWVKACKGEEYATGAGALEGLKACAAVEAMYRSASSGRAEDVMGCEEIF